MNHLIGHLPPLPRHATDSQALLTTGDVEALLWMYRRVEPHCDTAEVGTFYGGSAVLGAMWARDRGTRHWCIDEFGLVGSKFPWEPSMEIAWAHLRAEDLHRYAVLVAGDVETAGLAFGDGVFGAVFIDSDHTPEQAPIDMAWARRVTVSDGLVALHDLHGDNRYPGYQEAVEGLVAQWGWTEAFAAGSVKVYRLPSGGEA